MRPNPHLHAVAAPIEAATPIAVLPQAETIFFDAVPVFSHASGVLTATLSARRHLPDGHGGVVEQDVVVGFLRCGLPAAQALRHAVDAALLMARPTQGAPRN